MASDIFFLAFGERNAEENWHRLHDDFPYARRIDEVTGILNAHKECARLSRTSHFYVVDADNEVIDFAFDYRPKHAERDFVHIWYARNPVNGLEYGWGGIKLFPRKLLRAAVDMGLDMTTSFACKVIPRVASVTHFNTSPFTTWRSAFREAVKLAANRFEHFDDATAMRLATWCNVGENAAYGIWSMRGAQEGRDYAVDHSDDPAALNRINDFDWLRETFIVRHRCNG